MPILDLPKLSLYHIIMNNKRKITKKRANLKAKTRPPLSSGGRVRSISVLSADDTLCAVPAAGVVVASEFGNDDADSRGGGMDKLSVAYVDADVTDAVAAVILLEEYQIAGLKLALVDDASVVVVLGRRGAAHGISEVSIDVPDETGAVEAGGGALLAVDIRISDELESEIGDLAALGAAAGGIIAVP